MAITITGTDNGDGTGGVITVAGGNSGATNTLYYGAVSSFSTITWTAGNSRTGNGNIATLASTGQYFFYVDNNLASVHTLTNVLPLSLTDTTTSVHYRCLNAVLTVIQGLLLSGIDNNSIQVKWLPRVWENVDTLLLPIINIAPLGREGQPGILCGKDDIEYPCVVVIADKQNQNFTAQLARNTLWRQRIFRALRNQRLSGVTEIITTRVEPDYVIDPSAFNRNLFLSGLLILPRSREVRGT